MNVRIVKDAPIKVYTYWTNFSGKRCELGEYWVSDHSPEICKETKCRQHEKGTPYFWFQTTIDKEYLLTRMLLRDQKAQMFKMLDFYGRGYNG